MILCSLHIWISGLLSSFYCGLYSHETWQVLVVLLGGYQIIALVLIKWISILTRTTFLQVNTKQDMTTFLIRLKMGFTPAKRAPIFFPSSDISKFLVVLSTLWVPYQYLLSLPD